MRFMHIADVHLGVVPDKGKPWSKSRSKEIYSSFQRLLDTAKEEKIDLLLIAGDLFHFPPTMDMLRELDAQFMELDHVTTVLIAGNHDYRAKGSPLDRYEFQSDTVCLGTGEAKQLVLEDLHTCVTGISYDRKEIVEGIYDDLTPSLPGKEFYADYFQILLAHGGDSRHSPLDRNRLLRSGFDYIALGHIHKPEMIKMDQMINVGSLEPIDYTDTGERGYVIGEAERTDTGWQLHTEWRAFSSRQYVDLNIEIEPDMTNYQLQKQIQERMEAMGTEHIYRIILRGYRNAAFQADLSSLMNRYRIYEVLDKTQEAYDLEQLEEDNADNLLGQYIRTLKGQEDALHRQALEYGVKALLRCRETE